MALRDQPYLPLYIKDFLTDEKLIRCSAAATGVYIRIMCYMHKSAIYGTIILELEEQQQLQQCSQVTDYPTGKFVEELDLLLPYKTDEIEACLRELLKRQVLRIEGNKLIQNRMLSDGQLSLKRSKTALENDNAFGKGAAAKESANCVIESEVESAIESIIELLNKSTGSNFSPQTKATKTFIRARFAQGFILEDFKHVIEVKTAEWLNTDQEKYLRPETLFGNKFEGYRNQKPKSINHGESTASGKQQKHTIITGDLLADLDRKADLNKQNGG